MRRTWWRALVVLGPVAVVIGVLAAALFSDARSVCSSSLGVAAQGASHKVAGNCVLSDAIFVCAIALAAVGALAFVAGVIGLALISRTPGTWPPGWYPPAPGAPLRWWDGERWGPWA